MRSQAEKRYPERKCSGCGGRFPKGELVRILRTPDGSVTLDTTGKLSGRGSYICKSEKCLNKARKSGHIERSLKCSVSEEIYSRIIGELL